jgi:hypothetical protein
MTDDEALERLGDDDMPGGACAWCGMPTPADELGPLPDDPPDEDGQFCLPCTLILETLGRRQTRHAPTALEQIVDDIHAQLGGQRGETNHDEELWL